MVGESDNDIDDKIVGDKELVFDPGAPWSVKVTDGVGVVREELKLGDMDRELDPGNWIVIFSNNEGGRVAGDEFEVGNIMGWLFDTVGWGSIFSNVGSIGDELKA